MGINANQKRIKLWLDILLGIIGLVSLFALVANVGFYLDELELRITWAAIDIVIVIFIAQ